MSTTASPEYLTRAEVAQRYRIHPETVTDWVRQQKLPQPLRIGKRLLFRVTDLEALGRREQTGASGAK